MASSSPPPSILVLGSGELGRAILEALTSHPSNNPSTTNISVLMRPLTLTSTDTTKQKDLASLRSLGLNLIPGDIVQDAEDALAATFGQFDTVINALGMYSPPGTQTRLARAALASGCRRYFPWQFGVDYDAIGPASSQDLFTEQLAIREMLRGQERMEWVIVSTGMFTSFLFEPGTGLVDLSGEGEARVVGIGDSWANAITVTSPRDIGRVVAEIALACPEVKGVVFTAGDTVSMARLAEIVESVTGRGVVRELKTVARLKAELRERPDDGMRKYRVVFGEGVGVAWECEGTFNVRRGMEMETAEEWARANLAKM